MKIDNLVLVESFFLEDYLDRLKAILALIDKNPQAVSLIIQKQVLDLKEKEGEELDIDEDSFKSMIEDYSVALKNRLKAFKTDVSELEN